MAQVSGVPSRRVAGGLLLLAACTEPQERLLPAALALTRQATGALTVTGEVLPRLGRVCDTEGAGTGERLVGILDTATPLSAYRLSGAGNARALDDRILLRSAADQAGLAPVRGLLCDAPLIGLGSGSPSWALGLGDMATPLKLVVGGDVLRRYALQLSSYREPQDPTCTAPPCLRVGPSDISNNCQLAARGEAVLPFALRGGDLVLQLGSELIAVPPTRAVVDACMEPFADPGRSTPATGCLRVDLIEQRLLDLQTRIAELEAKAMAALGDARCDLLSQLTQLYAQRARLADLNRKLQGGDARCQTAALRLPAPDADAELDALLTTTQRECPRSPVAAQPTDLDVLDTIESDGLRAAAYLPSGTDARLLLSTAVPALVLSASLYARMTSDSRLKTVMQGKVVTLHLPGPGAIVGWPVSLGKGDAQQLTQLSLALLSRERHLSPCLELARSRRQRYGLSPVPTGAAQPAALACQKAACLQDLQRDPAQEQRRCAFSGQSRELACSDRTAPVAAVIELPLLEALVVADTAAVLQEVNGDLRSGGTPQVDGILGIPVLQRLAVEIDLAAGRLIGHCACGLPTDAAGCRTFARATYDQADDCAKNSTLQVSDQPVAVTQCLPQ